ncbi:hypothetical protein DSECCO2_501030 [anaerobic digester metagenome]
MASGVARMTRSSLSRKTAGSLVLRSRFSTKPCAWASSSTLTESSSFRDCSSSREASISSLEDCSSSFMLISSSLEARSSSLSFSYSSMTFCSCSCVTCSSSSYRSTRLLSLRLWRAALSGLTSWASISLKMTSTESRRPLSSVTGSAQRSSHLGGSPCRRIPPAVLGSSEEKAWFRMARRCSRRSLRASLRMFRLGSPEVSER